MPWLGQPDFADFQPMSREEMQRTMQFLLNHQAQFAADLQQVTGRLDRIADALLGVTGIVGRVIAQVERVAEQVSGLANSVGQLAEAQHRTDDRLNVVIDMFERHLREDHGRQPS
jgi:uncharacterized protein YoxC